MTAVLKCSFYILHFFVELKPSYGGFLRGFWLAMAALYSYRDGLSRPMEKASTTERDDDHFNDSRARYPWYIIRQKREIARDRSSQAHIE